ncbi:MAG TPA: AAA family ATPase [Oculatellaceae cyanobacterium]
MPTNESSAIERHPRFINYDDVVLIHRGIRHSIYRASENASGKTVALKLLLGGDHNSIKVSRLQQEYRLLKDRNISGMVKALGFWHDGNQCALAMQYAGSTTLSKLIARGPMGQEQFLRLALQLTQAISSIHRVGIIHLDLCPSNIVIDNGSGALTIVDFGTASTFSRIENSQTGPIRPAKLGSSLLYVSPEQTGRVNCPIDHRSDLYSLGAIFYEMLTGTTPFASSDPLELIHAHLSLAPVSPSVVNSTTPKILASIVLKLLAKDPDDRYQTAFGLAYDLECLQRQSVHKQLEPFRLGVRDRTPGLSSPDKLYGRSDELRLLTEAFENVIASDRAQLFLVSGYSGVGKTALVRNLYEPIAREKGFYLSGKFDQFKRDIPFATIVQAFQELIHSLLTESEDQITYWKEKLQTEIGDEIALITRILPQLELLVGKQQELPERPGPAERSRFNSVFKQFIKVFAQRAHPLVLFLDDLQWADSDSLQLIKNLIIEGSGLNLLLIGSFRDNEVGPEHALTRMFSEIAECKAPLPQILLKPLTLADLNGLVSDSLRSTVKQTEPLTKLIFEKTQGNPFFATQFLQMLYLEGLLTFDADIGLWNWDFEQIKLQKYTDNIVDLLLAKLHRLSEGARNILKMAACLGNVGDLETLMLVCQSGDDTEPLLAEAVKAGIILIQKGKYRFLHDRIQQAAYALIDDDLRPFEHLRIGRILFARMSELPAENIFEIVSHYNHGINLIHDMDERLQVAKLNCLAGKRSKLNTAYLAGLQYFSAGLFALTEENKRAEPELLFELRFEQADCLRRSDSLEQAESQFVELLSLAGTELEQATIYHMLVEIFATRRHFNRATELAIKGLSLLGIELPLDPSWRQVLREYEKVWQTIGGREIEDLIHLPAMTDRRMQCAVSILESLYPMAIEGGENFFVLCCCHIVNISLEYGNCDSSVFGYVQLGSVLPRIFDKYIEADKFGSLAESFLDRGVLRAYKARIQFAISTIKLWTHDIPSAIKGLYPAIRSGTESGDRLYAAICSICVWNYSFFSGVPLDDWHQLRTKLLNELFGSGADFFLYYGKVMERAVCGISSKIGVTAVPHIPDVEFEQAIVLSVVKTAYFAVKVQTQYIMGDYESAVATGRRSAAVFSRFRNWISEAEYGYYHLLALAAHYTEASADERKEYLELITVHVNQLKRYAEHNACNFQSKYALAAAELARITDCPLDAERLYEESISLAYQNGFVQLEAIANESAGRFYLARGMKTAAIAYFREARACYARWNADLKVAQLDKLYPELQEHQEKARSLDMLTVFKAAQAISKETTLHKLLETLMRVTVEAAGAQQGVLLLQQNDELVVRACGGSLRHDTSIDSLGKGTTQNVVIEEVPLNEFSSLPISVINYVRRTQETVVIDDALRESVFANDPHFKKTSTRSVLCLPIIKQSKLVGLLYLENSLTPRVFTTERIDLLHLLSSQIVTSLENVVLFEAVRLREEQFRLSFEMAAVGTAQYDLATEKFSRVNQKLCEITGYSEAELLAIAPTELVHPDDRQETVAMFLQASAEGVRESVLQMRSIRKDRQTIWVQLNGAFVRDASGQAISFLCVLQDITARLQAEESLKTWNLELEKQVNERTAELEQAKLVAEAANRAKSEFVANMSHEIRTPMNAVIGMSDLLNRTSLTVSQQDFVQSIQNSAQCLLDLINDILDFSKIEAGKLELAATDFDLHSLIESSAELLAETAHKKGISLMSYIAPEVPVMVHGDQARIRQVLLNLLSNANKFTAGGEVTLSVAADSLVEDKSVVYFVVHDTGIGMNETALARLFTPFSQADGSITRKYGGTGLGLSISKRLVQLMDGVISVESEEGKGSSFSFSVPLIIRSQPQSTADSSLAGKRVLLVNVPPEAARIIESYVTSWNMSCDTASNFTDTDEVVIDHENPYDFVLFDRHNLDDLVLERRIQKILKVMPSEMSRLILLGSSTHVDMTMLRKMGVSSYVSKPLRRARLLDCLLTADDGKDSQTISSVSTQPLKTRFTGPLILIAEDQKVNQKLAILQLQELGCFAEAVSNGREAVRAFGEKRYVLILMDCQMPEVDGFEATAEIRRLEQIQGAGHRIPIIAMTAQAMSGDREACLEAGMDDYVSKPVTSEKLAEALNRWIPEDYKDTGKEPVPVLDSVTDNATANVPPSADNRQIDDIFSIEKYKRKLAEWSTSFDSSTASELMNEITNGMRIALGELESAISKRDFEASKATAHRLKGMSLHFHVDETKNMSVQIEDDIKANDWQLAELHFLKLKHGFEKFMELTETE